MLDVEPGTHRVNSQDAPDRVVLFEMAADSVYFVKLWHKVGRRGASFGGIAPMEPVEGRRRISQAQMVPPDISDALRVEKRSGGWQLHNTSQAGIFVLIVEASIVDLLEWKPEVGGGGLQVPPFSSVRIPDSYMVGHARARHEAVVFWWQAVEHSDGTLRPGELQRRVVRFD